MIRLGTRGSALALAQARLVAAALEGLGTAVDVVPIRTSGDRLAHAPLAAFGGKAMFVKEIEEALLAGRVDVAVHSLKDVPAELPQGLVLAACPPREDPRDVLVARGPGGLDGLADGAVVATSSPRRRALVLGRRPGVAVAPIRGNVETRLAALGRGACDAVVLAAAGLRRLGLAPAHATPLDPDDFVPAVGQGIVAVEAREGDRRTLALLERVNDTRARMAAVAERALLRGLGASCHTAVAGHARLDGDALALHAMVASPDGRTILRGAVRGPAPDGEALGRRLAADLLARGAGPLLAAGEPSQ